MWKYSALYLALVLAPTLADAETYSFAVDQKFVNIMFESKMEIEDILGTTHVVTGWLKMDPKGGGTFRLEVPVQSLKTGIDLRDEHLRSPQWLNAKKNPLIIFEGNKVRALGGERYQVSGAFELAGKKKDLKVNLEVLKIPQAKAQKMGLGAENWLRVRGTFEVSLAQHGIKIPQMAAAKINDRWIVKVSLFAKSEK